MCIDFVLYTTVSKQGLDTRVSLKLALSTLGFKGRTRIEIELNQWAVAEKQERAKKVAAFEEQKAELKKYNATIQEANEK